MKFNERIWLNGSDIDDKTLETAHQRLLPKIDKDILEKLSYFEYTTLLAIEVFQECDFVILEAGLGGEFDATAVFDRVFTLVTPIGVDHQSFLGNSLKEIAKTKLRSIKTFGIFARQKKEVYQVADSLNISYHESRSFFTEAELKEMDEFIKKNGFASYLLENLVLAMGGVKKLGLSYDLSYLDGVHLRGRFEKISQNIIIDVGHNKQAALAIKNELKDKKVIMIYNTYKDKDFKEILGILKPNLEKVLIIDVKGERVVQKDILKTSLESLEIPFDEFSICNMEKDREYLVFGSFLVVEEFLRLYRI